VRVPDNIRTATLRAAYDSPGGTVIDELSHDGQTTGPALDSCPFSQSSGPGAGVLFPRASKFFSCDASIGLGHTRGVNDASSRSFRIHLVSVHGLSLGSGGGRSNVFSKCVFHTAIPSSAPVKKSPSRVSVMGGICTRWLGSSFLADPVFRASSVLAWKNLFCCSSKRLVSISFS